ncbi:MAG: cell division protein FtsL [Betaproteobacteria bacterium]|jgi:cell division protein FtsL|nr:cell division protein FtsL [Betaproteobacteria bacterium]
MRRELFLFLTIMMLSLWVIQERQQARRLYIDLQQARDEQVQLQTESDQLQIDKGTLSASGRIEDRAVHVMGMLVPQAGQKRLLILGQNPGGAR